MRIIRTILRKEKTWRNNISSAYIHVPKHLLSEGLKIPRNACFSSRKKQQLLESTVNEIDKYRSFDPLFFLLSSVSLFSCVDKQDTERQTGTLVFDIERRGKACSISRDAKDDAKRAKTRNANGGGKYRFLFEPLLEFSFDRGWRMRGDGIFRDGVPRNGPPLFFFFLSCLKDFEMDRIANIKVG